MIISTLDLQSFGTLCRENAQNFIISFACLDMGEKFPKDNMRHVKGFTVVELFDDWHGACNFCPENDSYVHGVIAYHATEEHIYTLSASVPFVDLMESIGLLRRFKVNFEHYVCGCPEFHDYMCTYAKSEEDAITRVTNTLIVRNRNMCNVEHINDQLICLKDNQIEHMMCNFAAEHIES